METIALPGQGSKMHHDLDGTNIPPVEEVIGGILLRLDSLIEVQGFRQRLQTKDLHRGDGFLGFYFIEYLKFQHI